MSYSNSCPLYKGYGNLLSCAHGLYVRQAEHKWELNEEGEREYKPINKLVPRVEAVSCWDFYPDP